jgi:hypothetical protein
VPLAIGQSPTFGPDTKVTLCQGCSGQLIAFLRGEPVPQAPRIVTKEDLKAIEN